VFVYASAEMRTTRLALVLCLLLGTVACFDYEEEVWLERSGAGRAQLTVKMPDQLLSLAQSAASMQRQGAGGQNPLAGVQSLRFTREEAEKSFANRQGIRVIKVDEIKEAGMVGYRIELSFDSLAHLEEALSSRQKNGLPVNNGGKLALVENGRSFRFHRQVGAGKASPAGRVGSKSADQAAESMAALFFANHYLTYRYHFPFKIVSGNATRTDPETNTAEWKFGLADAMAGELDMQAELTAGRPAWFFVVLAIAVAGILTTIVRFFRSRYRGVAAFPASPSNPAVRQATPRFQTREEYEAWKVAQSRHDGT
jgi:hypothetical protein